MKWNGSPEAAIVPKGNVVVGERTALDRSAPEGVGREQNTRRPYLQEQSMNQKRERDRTGSCEEKR